MENIYFIVVNESFGMVSLLQSFFLELYLIVSKLCSAANAYNGFKIIQQLQVRATLSEYIYLK